MEFRSRFISTKTDNSVGIVYIIYLFCFQFRFFSLISIQRPSKGVNKVKNDHLKKKWNEISKAIRLCNTRPYSENRKCNWIAYTITCIHLSFFFVCAIQFAFVNISAFFASHNYIQKIFLLTEIRKIFLHSTKWNWN